MKTKLTFIGVCIVLLFGCSLANAKQTLYKLGNSPFFTPPLTSIADLNNLVSSVPEDIKAGFALAGLPELYQPFMNQYPDAEIREIRVAKGETLAWMLYKKNGKGPVRITRNVSWGADSPFKAYELDIDYNGSRYVMVIPFACGNLALREVSNIPAPVVEPPKENLPPQTIAFALPETANCNTPATVDARKSNDPDGTVEKVSITATGPDGKVVLDTVLTEKPFVTDFARPCGKTTIQVTAVDNLGLAGNTVDLAVEGVRSTRLVGDVAFMRQFDPSNWAVIRTGIEHYFTDSFSVLALLGGGAKTGGNIGEPVFVADLLAKYSYGDAFAAVGLGGWVSDGNSDNKLEDNDLDVVTELGYRVCGDPGDMNFSVFAEARFGTDELENVAKYGKYGIGLRVQF